MFDGYVLEERQNEDGMECYISLLKFSMVVA